MNWGEIWEEIQAWLTSEGLSEVGKSLLAWAQTIIGKLLLALIVFIVGRIVIKVVVKKIRKSKLSKKMEPTAAIFLGNFFNIALNIVLVVSIIAILGVPMASIVAVVAACGAAVGLALQGALSNLAGGIMILIFHPFRAGHFIDAAGFSGTVKDIDIFYTVIHTPDNKVITIPNGTIMASSITNYSINDTRRVDLTFGVAYGTDVEKVKSILMEEAMKHEKVLKDPEPFCRLSEQNASSLDFVLRAWTSKDDYWQVHFDLLEAINDRFAQENIEIPFNQIDVHMK